MNRLSVNIKNDYIYKFFSAFDITSAIWVLYLGFKGMTLAQIGLLEGIFHITGFLSEIPTGALADLFGRKKIIIIGRITSLISAIIMLFSNSFMGFAIGFILSAWGYNLNSGSEEALIYDTLKKLDREEEFLKVNGKINLIIEVSQGLAVFIGGILSQIDFSISYITAVVIGSISLVLSTRFIEVDVIRKENQSINIINHLRQSIDIVKNNKRLLNILIFFPLIYTFSAIIYFYGQQLFNDMEYSRISISIIFLFNGIFSSLGAILSSKIYKKYKSLGWIMISISISVFTIFMGIGKGNLSIVFFLGIGFLTSILQPISSNLINSMVESNQRATIISVESMFYSIMMIILFPICGFIGDRVYLELSFIMVGIVGVLICITEIIIIKKTI
ncbi:major facilitator superfamily protein [Clostridium sartagoforme AAU1]|jgi:MFS family permease|uniref:Major facilitator superfamily protein n=1 Tax=Clostridium sartagoforme AAU1 TaxID=1202534 RepID=R9C623_9CLOT|nr:MFS transporter [Clostridium sartagoforme]EOR24440.1 major facilitator superfamily protein [Clostridium sartagoforme AAU1]